MKIAILGSGGREHAIAFSISQSKKSKKYTVFQVMLEHLKFVKMFLLILTNLKKSKNF